MLFLFGCYSDLASKSQFMESMRASDAYKHYSSSDGADTGLVIGCVRVYRADQKTLLVDLGSMDGMAKGMELIIIDTEGIPSIAEVTQVDLFCSAAKITGMAVKSNIEKGNRVLWRKYRYAILSVGSHRSLFGSSLKFCRRRRV